MKQSLLTLLFIVPFLFITSCNDNSVNNSKQRQKPDLAKLDAKYSKVGKLHNEGLNNIYEAFKQGDKIRNKEQLFKTIKNSGNGFFKSKFHSKNNRKKILRAFDKKIDGMEQRSRSLGKMKSSTLTSHLETKMKNSDKITIKQKHLIKKLKDVVKNYSASLRKHNKSSFSSYTEALHNVEKQAASQLDSKKKLIPIVIGAKVAESSMKYWLKNHKKWAKVMKNKIIMDGHSVPSSANLANIKKLKTGQPITASGYLEGLVGTDLGSAATAAITDLTIGTGEATAGLSTGTVALVGGLAGSTGYNVEQYVEQAGDWIKSWF